MDFYILLGLERAASVGDIKRAYKRLARRYHPDINPGDRLAAAQFRQIAEAYETLDRSGSPPPLRRDRLGDARRPSRRPSVSRGSTSPSASADRRRRPSAICSRTCSTSATRGVTKRTPERGSRSPSDDHDRVRRGDSRRAAPADRHAAGALPHLPRRGLAAGRRDAVPVVPGRRDGQDGARAHGVLENLRAVRRHRASAPARAVRPVRGSRSKCAPSRSR